MPFISIISPCYNEEKNVQDLYSQVKAVFDAMPGYTYEHIFIDNASVDRTVDLLKQMAATDKNVKIIVNARNFGHIRSPYYALFQASGDAVILIASDLQEPTELIRGFIEKWEAGAKIVAGIKLTSDEFPMMFIIRKLYYATVSKLSEVTLTKNFTGFGLYDRRVIDILSNFSEPYPYFRGLISELGFEIEQIVYHQPNRKRGITKNNFYTLYDIGMLGIVSHSKVPLRLAAMLGFCLAVLSFMVAMGFIILKLLFWNHFAFGLAPLLVGVFFFSSIQLFFIGLLGEYIGTIHTRVVNRPLVIEKERINF